MGFGSEDRSQEDIVAREGVERPESVTEELNMPAFDPKAEKGPLEMSESELVKLFTTILKSRIYMNEMEFTLGEAYETKEVVANVTKSGQIAELSFLEVAELLVYAMSQNSKAVGFRSIVERKDDKTTSKVFLKVADKKPSRQDKEYKPVCRLTYSPTV